ncbi:MAG: hypothetical protein HRF43_04200, partial [Phycisphaerae bacterium]
GGAVRLSVQGTVHVDGLLDADGANAPNGGGGAGGSVLITAYQFQGAGLITARGGNGTDNLRGGGGGGRIALFYSAFTDFLNTQVLVNGGAGFQAGQPGTIHLATGAAPVLEPIADDSVPEGASYDGPVPFVSAGVPPFVFELVSGPAGMTIDELTGRVAWSYATAGGSPYTVSIRVNNPFGSDEKSYQLTVVPSAPVIAEIADGTFEIGSSYVGPQPVLTQGTPPVAWSIVTAPDGTQIDVNTGVVTWNTPVVEGNPHVFTIRATNALGSDDESWHISVQAPPIIDEILDVTIAEGSSYTGPLPTLLQGAPAPTWSLIAAPAGMSIDTSTGVVSWPNATATGSPHTVTIRALNVRGSDDESWQVTVEPAAPLIAAIEDQVTLVGQLFVGPMPVLLQGSPGVVWSLAGTPPAEMTIDPDTGVVSWASPTAEGSPYTVTLRAENAIGADEVSFLLSVLVPPIIAEIPDDVIQEGSPYTGPVPVLAQGSPPVTWSLVAAPAGATIHASTGVVSWPNPTAAGSPHTITIRATNAVGADDESWQLGVTAIPPVIAALPDAAIPAGQPYQQTVTLVQGSAPIAWSLVSPPEGMTISPAGVIEWPNPTEVGSPFTIIVRAENVAGFDEEEYVLAVGFAPVIQEIADVEVNEGAPYTGPTPVLLAGSPPVMWSLLVGSEGMTIDPDTGVVSWAKAVAAASPHVVRIKAENVFGSDTEEWLLAVPVSYTASVSTAVTMAPSGTPVLLEGDAVLLPGGTDPAADVPVTIRVRVQGTRRIIKAQTNAAGHFAALFNPLPTEAGFYEVGADHPAIPTDQTQDTFTLVGMRTSPLAGSLTVTPGGNGQSSLVLRNLGDTPLSGISATVEGAPPDVEVQYNAPASLNPLEQARVDFTVVSTGGGNFHGLVNLVFTSAEGATARYELDLTVRPPQPVLQSDPPELAAAMLRGEQTIVPFVVTNIGGSVTGPLTIQVPSEPWLTVISPNPTASLAPGESTTIELQLLPPQNLVLGPYAGSLNVGRVGVVNLNVPFTFTAISEGKGGLRVIAEDEFTYWGAGNPPLAGASVVLKDPINGAIVATGVTDADGVLFEDLTEAYYAFEVTAPDHTSASGTVLVPAGRVKTIRPFLSREVVSYSWEVKPTTITDVYKLVVEAVFETNVPAPVVTVDPPHVDLDTLGCEAQIDFTITNHGLITANEMSFNVASSSRWEVTALVTDIGDLPAHTSVVVPVRFRNKLCPAGGAGGVELASHLPGADAAGCDNPAAQVIWNLVCGTKRFYGTGVAMTQASSSCPGGVGGGSGGGSGGGMIIVTPHPSKKQPCDPCDFDLALG